MDSSPYSQHPQLLEPREVVLVDPSDVVPVEFPGGGKENGMVRRQGQAPRPGLSSILPSTELQPVFSLVGPGASQPSLGPPSPCQGPTSQGPSLQQMPSQPGKCTGPGLAAGRAVRAKVMAFAQKELRLIGETRHSCREEFGNQPLEVIQVDPPSIKWG